jgi:hypothetical protein
MARMFELSPSLLKLSGAVGIAKSTRSQQKVPGVFFSVAPAD